MKLRIMIPAALVLGVGGPTLSCGTGGSGSGSDVKFLGEADRIGGGQIKESDQEVVVYYANETDPTGLDLANFNQIIAALKSGQKTHDLAVKIEDDKVAFGGIVDSEVKALSDRLCQSGNKTGVSLIVFDNRFAKQRRFRYCKGGEGLKVADSPDFDEVLKAAGDDYRLKSHPLTGAAGFRWAMKQVSRTFPGKDTLANLIVRSHGIDRGNMLMSPRLNLRYERLDGNAHERRIAIQNQGFQAVSRLRATFAKTCSGQNAMIMGRSSIGTEGDGFQKEPDGFQKEPDGFQKEPDGFQKEPDGFQKEPDGFQKEPDGFQKEPDGFQKEPDGFQKEPDGFFKEDGFAKIGFDSISELSKDVPGLTKSEFLQSLAESGLRYGVVATLSCYSSWKKTLAEAGDGTKTLPVEWLVGADESGRIIPYEAMDFASFLNQYQTAPSTKIAYALQNYLAKVSQAQKQKNLNGKKKMCQLTNKNPR